MASEPLSWQSRMMSGSVEGSRRKVTSWEGEPCRAAWSGGRRRGLEEARSRQLVRVMARVGARAGQAPESRCSRSPLGAVQEGRQQAPDRPFQWRRSQYGVRR